MCEGRGWSCLRGEDGHVLRRTLVFRVEAQRRKGDRGVHGRSRLGKKV